MYEEEKPRPQQPGDLLNKDQAARRGYSGIRAAACLTLPFLFYGGGKEVRGKVHALLALVLWAIFTHDLFCLYYLYAWLAASVAYTLTASWKYHPYSEGTPYLQLLVPGYWAASFLTTAAVLGIGVAAYQVAPYLGMLLIASGLGRAGDQVVGWWLRRKEIVAYRVGQHEMHARREAYKRGW